VIGARLEFAALLALVACWVAWARFMDDRAKKKAESCV
jgi:hypothetical protein